MYSTVDPLGEDENPHGKRHLSNMVQNLKEKKTLVDMRIDIKVKLG